LVQVLDWPKRAVANKRIVMAAKLLETLGIIISACLRIDFNVSPRNLLPNCGIAGCLMCINIAFNSLLWTITKRAGRGNELILIFCIK